MTTLMHINSNYLVSRLHENLVDNLKKEGIDQLVFMPIKNELKAEFTFKSHNEVYNPVAFRNMDKYFFSYKQLKIFKKLKDTIDIDKIGLVHAHSLFTDGNIAYKLYKERKIPYVVTIREFTDMDFFKRRPNLRLRGKRILLNAEKIVFLSEKSKDVFLGSYLKSIKNEVYDKISVIPNGIDPFWFKNQNQAKSLKNQQTLQLLFVGRIMKSKNIPLIYSAIKALKEKNNIVASLTIVGAVKDVSEFKKLKAMNDINVEFVDYVNKNTLREIYRFHDIFIMPSIRESFGLVYAEALSQGLPVIYSKTSGFYKQFNEGRIGYGVDPYSSEDVREKIIKIIENYDHLSKEAVKAYKIFNWEEISRKYAIVYNELVKK